MARLVVVEGPWKGLEFALEEGKTQLLGRGDACDLAIPDKALSREHCRLSCSTGTWSVEDLGSRNGISVNAQQVRARALERGDLIGAGQSVIRFLEGDELALVAHTRPVTATMQIEVPSGFDPSLDLSWRGEHYVALLGLSERLAHTQGTAEVELVFAQWLLKQIGGARAIVFHRRAGRLIDAGVIEPDGLRRSSATTTLPAPVLLAAGDGRCVFLEPEPGELGGRFLTPLASPARSVFLIEHVIQTPTKEELRLAACGSDLASGTYLRWEHTESLASRVEVLPPSFESRPLVAESSAMQSVVDFIGRVAAVDSTVLLLGESGVGKELVARKIHEQSLRSNAPFVAVNCGALPETLMEAELFGHEKGAFTGASARRLGRFERANCGTLFLDEVGDLTLPAQGRLLRVLEERVVERIGGSEPIAVDVRIIAATNKDLKQMTSEGSFRDDLYYRLSVLILEIPPLRERKEDVPALAELFLEQLKNRAGRVIEGFSEEAEAALCRYDWPGNVRELRNALERAMILGRGPRIALTELPAELRAHGDGAEAHAVEEDLVRLPLPLGELERRAVMAALRASRGNKSRAARLLGIDRATLYARLKTYGVDEG